jgi:hypothetical protein
VTLRLEDSPPRDLAAVYRAVMLAQTLQVCEALLRGETVPIGKLDPVWVARLGRR